MVFNNFADLGKHFGIEVPRKKNKKERPFLCRKCGEAMVHIPNTNVFLCTGHLPDGSECENRVFTKTIA